MIKITAGIYPSKSIRLLIPSVTSWQIFPVDTGLKLNEHKMFRRRPGFLLNVLYLFNLRPVSTGFPFCHNFLFFSYQVNVRSSRLGVFCKKIVFFRNFAKFTAKHLRQSLFLNRVARTSFLQNTLGRLFLLWGCFMT